MSEYTFVEKPFLDQLRTLGWEVIDQGEGFPSQDPGVTLRTSFRELFLPDVFRETIRSLDLSGKGEPRLKDRQLDELQDQILRQPKRALLEANESGQETLIQGLLAPKTLLHILRTGTVYMDTTDGTRIKVLCRCQQYRAAYRILERLRHEKTPEERSGVVWHTQGSGKSLTMAFVSRMLRAASDLQDFKLIMVNDRVDLEEQLSATAALIGGKINVIESTADLRKRLSTDASDVNLVMVHKFSERGEDLPESVARALEGKSVPSGKTFGVVNSSARILLMVDEAHRTQGSDLGENLFEALPSATRIAFAGTPLISEQHGARRTVKRFGEYIDTYKLMDAVRDGTTLQILYEGRTADTALMDKHGFDSRFEDLFKDRTEEDPAAIKRKYGATGDILEAEKRIEAIARDLVDHYVDNILPEGFKAHVVCHSKLAAVRYQKAIRVALKARVDRERGAAEPHEDLIRRIEFLKAAVVISADAVTEPAAFTTARKEAARWDAVRNFCKPFKVEQVMYIDKKLQEHNLRSRPLRGSTGWRGQVSSAAML